MVYCNKDAYKLPEKRELGPVTDFQEVIGVNGPCHHPGQALVISILCLGLDAPLVVVAEPHVIPEHEGGAVVLIPLHPPARPRPRVLNLLDTDLIVAKEAILPSVRALEMRQSNYVPTPNKQTRGCAVIVVNKEV